MMNFYTKIIITSICNVLYFQHDIIPMTKSYVSFSCLAIWIVSSLMIYRCSITDKVRTTNGAAIHALFLCVDLYVKTRHISVVTD